MRELKFRVWDLGSKSWRNFLYVNVIDWQASGNDKTKYIFQQFTGLKDKNGVEIYEGDIVRVHYVLGKDVGVIVWSDCLFGYEISYKCERRGESESLRAENLRYEVIGNTFENPELLCAN